MLDALIGHDYGHRELLDMIDRVLSQLDRQRRKEAGGEAMRARLPDQDGFIERDGVKVGYEASGEGERTLLFLPTWTMIHSRCWKAQVPYFARHIRVVTFDARGNGRADHVEDPALHDEGETARDAVAVLDLLGVERAGVIGLSRGGRYALRLWELAPDGSRRSR